MRSRLAAAVDDQHGARPKRRREVARGRVRDVVADEADLAGVEAERLQEARGAADVERAQPLPLVGRDVVAVVRRKRRVVGVADRIEVVGRDPAALQAPRDRLLGQLPGRERHARLAVLAAAEALLLGGGHDAPVDHQRGRRVVEDGVDPQDAHGRDIHRTGRASNLAAPGNAAPMADNESKTTTDHDEIRRWAEERGGKPATVKGTESRGEDAGILRIDFPGGEEDRLEEIPWDEWFEKFDSEKLAFLYQEEVKSGDESRFFKLVNR